MHLLVTQPGEISDGTEAVDLGQSAGDIIFLSAAASELALLSEAAGNLSDLPSLRLANLMQLTHNMAVDVYLENTVSAARLVVVRLLGGVGYWSYGAEQLVALARVGGAERFKCTGPGTRRCEKKQTVEKKTLPRGYL